MNPVLVDLANAVVTNAFKMHPPEKCAVACSFGKDSTVVLDLVRRRYPKVLVVFSNTGVEYPETLKFRDRLVREWSLNYVEARPTTTFWKVTEKYGLPLPRAAGSRAPKCCYYLKEVPAAKVYKDHKTELVFTGLTAAESHARTMFAGRCGEYYFAKTQGLWKCHPIMSWKEVDVWDYIRENALPYNSFYDKNPGHRVGCMPCTSYRSWMKRMAKASPKMYRKIQSMRGQGLID